MTTRQILRTRNVVEAEAEGTLLLKTQSKLRAHNIRLQVDNAIFTVDNVLVQTDLPVTSDRTAANAAIRGLGELQNKGGKVWFVSRRPRKVGYDAWAAACVALSVAIFAAHKAGYLVYILTMFMEPLTPAQ